MESERGRSALRRLAARGQVELLVGIPLIWFLRHLRLAIPGNLRVFIAVTCGGAAALNWATASFQARADRGSDRLRLLDCLLHVVYVATVIYLTGWGPILSVAFVVIGTTMLDDMAGRWRLMVILTLGVIAIGQAGIALDVIPTYLSHGAAQAVGVMSALTTVMALRGLGVTAAAREAAEQAKAVSDEAARRSEERFRTVVR